MGLFVKGQIPWNKDPLEKICMNCNIHREKLSESLSEKFNL